MLDSVFAEEREPTEEGAGAPEAGPRFYHVGILREQYREFVQIKSKEIAERKVARHYYNGDQWTAKQLKTLRGRGQNPITKNRIARKINGMVGVLARMRSDPKAYPRTPQEEQRGGSDIATACVRYVMENVDWSTIKQECLRQAMVDGIGGVEFELLPSPNGDNDSDLGINIVENDTFFYDPKSVKLDFSDARYMGVAKTVDLDTAIDMLPHKAQELKELASKGGGGDEFYSHNEREKLWSHSSSNRIPLVDHWYRSGGTWLWCLYAGDVMIDQGETPFIDDRQRPVSKFMMFSAACDHDGDRYGFVRNMKSPQDEINHTSSKRLHLIGAKTLKINEGSVKNVELLRREITRADGVVVVNPGQDIEIIQHDADIAALTAMHRESLDEIENQGPNPALMGQGVENKSGRAINLLQQAGIAELGPFIASYEGWELRVFRFTWNGICQHWTAGRMVRVTDREDLVQFIEVNGIGFDEAGNPALINALGELDVDIRMDRGPNVANVMADAYENLLALAGSGGQVPPQVFIKLLPGLPSDIRQEVLEMMEPPQPDPMEEQAKQVALEQEQAKTGKFKADTFKATADAVTKIAQSPLGMGGMSQMAGMMPDGGGAAPQMAPEAPPMAGMAPEMAHMQPPTGTPDIDMEMFQAAMPQMGVPQVPVQQSFGF